MKKPFDRCELECCSNDGEYAACDGFHSCRDEHTLMGYCVKAGLFDHGCEVCQNALVEGSDNLNNDVF